jgi:hypothetical protein
MRDLVSRALAASILLVMACGGDSVSLDAYPEALNDAVCDFLVKCGQAKDHAACRAANLGFENRLNASQLDAIQRGRAKYNSGKAQDCLDGIAGRSCDTTSQAYRELPAACAEAITGTLGDGEKCAVDEECGSQVCDVPSCDAACCLGTCFGATVAARAKVGESCEVADCEASAYCDSVSTTCVAVKGAGASCQGSDECSFGLDCILPAGMCGSLPTLGESCTSSCRDLGTTCNAASHTCVKVALENEACSNSSDCAQLYVCSTSKRCVRGVALGDPCTRGQRCADAGSFCDVREGESMGTCVLPKPDGATCQFAADCDSGVCDPMTKQCIADKACLP